MDTHPGGNGHPHPHTALTPTHIAFPFSCPTTPPFCWSPQQQHGPLPSATGNRHPLPAHISDSELCKALHPLPACPQPVPHFPPYVLTHPKSNIPARPPPAQAHSQTDVPGGTFPPSVHARAHHALTPFPWRPPSRSGPAPPPAQMVLLVLPIRQTLTPGPLDIAIPKQMEAHQNWQPAATAQKHRPPAPSQLPRGRGKKSSRLARERAPRPRRVTAPPPAPAARLTLDPEPSGQQGQDSTPSRTHTLTHNLHPQDTRLSHSLRHTWAHSLRFTVHSCPQRGPTSPHRPTQVRLHAWNMHRHMVTHAQKHSGPPHTHSFHHRHPHKPAPGHRGPLHSSGVNTSRPQTCPLTW